MKKITAMSMVLVILMSLTVLAESPIQSVAVQESLPVTISYKEVPVQGAVTVIDGKHMVPLRWVAEAMGYEVNWNGEDRSVDILKKAQFTTVRIGENAYFKGRMAHFPLSAAPVIVEGRTFVPVEFFHEVLDVAFSFNAGNLDFMDVETESPETLVTHTGVIAEIEESETGIRYFLKQGDVDEVSLIVSASGDYALFQRYPKEGEVVNFVSHPIMLLSYPGQTGAVVVY